MRQLLAIFFLLCVTNSYAGTEEDFKRISIEFNKQEELPVVISPQARNSYLNENKLWNWKKLEKYAIGYADNEDLNKLISESNRNYKMYQSTEPDFLKGGTLKVKFRGYDISSMAKYFDNECRTFLEYSEELNGEATIYSENYVPQAVNCEMIIVAFTMNKVKLKKAKRGRTLVVEQK